MPTVEGSLRLQDMRWGWCPNCRAGKLAKHIPPDDWEIELGRVWKVQLYDCPDCEGTGRWPWPSTLRRTEENVRAYQSVLERERREWYFTRLWRMPGRGARLAASAGWSALQGSVSRLWSIRARGLLGRAGSGR